MQIALDFAGLRVGRVAVQHASSTAIRDDRRRLERGRAPCFTSEGSAGLPANSDKDVSIEEEEAEASIA